MRALITLLAKSHEPPSIAQVCGVDIVEDAVKTSQVLLRATRFSLQGVRIFGSDCLRRLLEEYLI